MNTTDTTLFLELVLLENSHLMIGILDNKGTPLPLRLFSVRSIPPNAIISSFLTRTIDLNFELDAGGGADSEGESKKSEILMSISNVT